MNTLFANIVKAFFGKGRAVWDVQEFPFLNGVAALYEIAQRFHKLS